MSKYLVTGGAGFIGSNIVEELLNMGEDVVVLDNLSTGCENNMKQFIGDIRFVEGDIRDAEAVDTAMEGVEYVFHQAALASVPRSIDDPVLVNEVNVGGTVNVLERAKKAGVRSFVYAASSSAYGDVEVSPKDEGIRPEPLSPYAVSKLAGEYYCRVYNEVYGLETISLRYFNVFGPRQDPASQYAAVVPIFINSLLKGERPTIYGDGEQSRDFTFVSNVVKANILASKVRGAGGKVVNIACGEKYTVNELFRTVAKRIGSDIEPKYEEQRPGDVRHSLADISEAEKLMGYKVGVSFEEGIDKTVDWYRQETEG